MPNRMGRHDAAGMCAGSAVMTVISSDSVMRGAADRQRRLGLPHEDAGATFNDSAPSRITRCITIAKARTTSAMPVIEDGEQGAMKMIVGRTWNAKMTHAAHLRLRRSS